MSESNDEKLAALGPSQEEHAAAQILIARAIKKSCRTQLHVASKYCSANASYSFRNSASFALPGLLSANRFTGPPKRSL